MRFSIGRRAGDQAPAVPATAEVPAATPAQMVRLESAANKVWSAIAAGQRWFQTHGLVADFANGYATLGPAAPERDKIWQQCVIFQDAGGMWRVQRLHHHPSNEFNTANAHLITGTDYQLEAGVPSRRITGEAPHLGPPIIRRFEEGGPMSGVVCEDMSTSFESILGTGPGATAIGATVQRAA